MSQSDGWKKSLMEGKKKEEITGESAHEKYARMHEADVEALCEDLRRIGLKATVESKERKRLNGVPGICSSWNIGSVRVANRNIDLVELNYNVSVSQPTGDYPGGDILPIEYWCNFVVQAKVEGLEEKLRAEGKPVRKSFFSRQFVDFRWKGKELAQILNSDAKLKSHLLSQRRLRKVVIAPFKEDRCVRMSYDSALSFPPTIESFEAYDRIAKHIRSITNVSS